jgi:outer membrane receptor for ferrienterochelin and colicin
MKTHRISRITGALVLALGLSTSALANETSSGIAGQILTPQGQAAANTTIIVTHIPTGSVKRIQANSTGNYSLKGLRVGGPYKIVIDSEIYKDQEFSNFYLQAGKLQRLSVDLEDEDREVISVIGSRSIGYINSGSSGSFGASEIADSAGGERDLKGVLRFNPLVSVGSGEGSPMSIAGSNPRFNSFSVDGVRQNDDFGLNGNGYPTQRSPISIDAVEQVSVETTPYSVKNGGFSGGQINVVTKSGTNDFHGSFFFEKESDDWAGTPKNIDGEDIPLEFESTTFAGTLGGPIIQDKLFFFASYEKYDQPTSVEWGPAGSGQGNDTRFTEAEYNQVKDIADRIYGVDIGTYSASPEEKDEKILVKLDWNINEDHRAAFTYQNTEGNSTRNMTSRSSELKMSTHWYDKNENLTALSGHLYSDWNADFSTEIKVAYKDVETEQAPKNKMMGDVTVRGENGSIAFGPDKSRHGNALENQTLSLRFLGEYLYKGHEITFGAEYETIDVTNLYAPNSLGTWEFNNIADFENRLAGDFEYSNAYTNNVDDAAASFKFSTTTLFIEDAFNISDSVLLTAGVRYEVVGSSDSPTQNANFQERYGYSNSANMDGESIFLPRLGINWDATDDLVVRGGIGRFSGGRPNVWLSNSYSNDGVTFVNSNNAGDYLTDVDITQIPQGVLNGMESGDGNVNFTDPNFKMPSDWRTNIALDYRFDIPSMGDDWMWSAEFIHIKKENDPFWQDVSRSKTGETTAGGRPIYEADDKGRYDLMLTNADDNGESNILTTSLSKSFDSGVSFNMSYTNQDVTEGTPGTSSTATSNFQYPITLDRGRAEVGRAAFEVEHSLKINIDYRAEFVSNYATKFNLFFERRSGKPLSWVMGSFRNGDLGDQYSFDDSDAYLPYIPSGADDPNVAYDNGLSYSELKGYLDQAGLSKYGGGYAQKGSSKQPWQTTLDFRIAQEIPGFVDGHKGELFFNVRNLLNLIDDTKGQKKRSQYGNKIIADYGINDDGQYVYSAPFGGFDAATADTVDAKSSAWGVKIGVRYTF